MPAYFYFAPMRKEYSITLRGSQYFFLKIFLFCCLTVDSHRKRSGDIFSDTGLNTVLAPCKLKQIQEKMTGSL